MAVKIYWISGSAPAWRVLLTLETKKIEYESRILETSKKEQKEPWYLKISPRGQVPVLVDNDVCVSESLAIMHYLESQYPSPKLLGSTPKDTARIEQCVHEILSYTDPAISGFVQPVFRGKSADLEDSIIEKSDKINEELALVNNLLINQDWLLGQFSTADIVLIPTMQRLTRAAAKAPELAQKCGLDQLDVSCPALMDWCRRTESLPEFAATFPPHWKTS